MEGENIMNIFGITEKNLILKGTYFIFILILNIH